MRGITSHLNDCVSLIFDKNISLHTERTETDKNLQGWDGRQSQRNWVMMGPKKCKWSGN